MPHFYWSNHQPPDDRLPDGAFAVKLYLFGYSYCAWSPKGRLSVWATLLRGLLFGWEFLPEGLYAEPLRPYYFPEPAQGKDC